MYIMEPCDGPGRRGSGGEQFGQRRGDRLGGATEIFERQAFIGAMGVGVLDRTRPGAVKPESPWALRAIVGPGPNFRLTMRLVAETMPVDGGRDGGRHASLAASRAPPRGAERPALSPTAADRGQARRFDKDFQNPSMRMPS